MNVLFIADNSLSNPILSSQGIPHIQENKKRGINFSVLSFENPNLLNSNKNVKQQYEENFNELKSNAEIHSVSLRMDKTSLQRKIRYILVFLLGIRKTIQIVKKNNIDIIHGRSNQPTLIGVIVKKFVKVKVLYDNRGLVSDEIDRRLWFRIFFEGKKEEYLIKKSDAIVVVSNAFKEYLYSESKIERLKSKIEVIENSFSENRFKFSEQFRSEQREKYHLADKLVMVYSGPSVFWQRFDLVLTTFKILKHIRNDAFLMIISYDTEIENIVRNEGIDSKDFVVHNLSASEVNKFLVMGDFGVKYRDDRILNKVCAPIKFGEYLACGLPILTMDQIGDSETLIKKYNVGAILKKESEIKDKLFEIIDLIKKPGIRIKCRTVAEENLSVKISSQKYFSVYQKM